jgi:hypothetical protein
MFSFLVAMFPFPAVFHIEDMFYRGSLYSASKVGVFDIGMYFFAKSLDGTWLLRGDGLVKEYPESRSLPWPFVTRSGGVLPHLDILELGFPALS